jgi:hypothetical protein
MWCASIRLGCKNPVVMSRMTSRWIIEGARNEKDGTLPFAGGDSKGIQKGGRKPETVKRREREMFWGPQMRVFVVGRKRERGGGCFVGNRQMAKRC